MGASIGSSQSLGLNMGKSVGRGISSSATGNTVLQQMVMGQNDYADSSIGQRQLTVLDELTAQELERIVLEYEEQKIQHQRNKQDELRQLENEKMMAIAQIREEADDEIQYMMESLKHEIKASQEGYSDEQKKIKLKEESRQSIQNFKDNQDRNYEKNSQRKKNRIDEAIQHHRLDQKTLHDREM